MHSVEKLWIFIFPQASDLLWCWAAVASHRSQSTVQSKIWTANTLTNIPYKCLRTFKVGHTYLFIRLGVFQLNDIFNHQWVYLDITPL